MHFISYLFLRTKKATISAKTSVTMIATTTPAMVPVVNPLPVRASFPPIGGAADLLEPPGFDSVPTENTTICDGVVVGIVSVFVFLKGSVVGIKVGEPVVLPVNEFECWLLVVVGV